MNEESTYLSKRRPLWAPWRIEYILDKQKDKDCFICNYAKTPGEDVKNHVIVRGERVFVFLNRYPYNSGHLLISPYRHVARLQDLTKEERNEIFALLANVERILFRYMESDGINIGVNLGKAAGAGVEDHLHFHIVPRWIGDTNFMPVIAETNCVPQALADTAAFLRQHWNS